MGESVENYEPDMYDSITLNDTQVPPEHEGISEIWYFSDLYRVQTYLKWPWALIQAQPAAQRSKIGILEPVLPPFSCSSGLLTLLVGISNFRRSSSPGGFDAPLRASVEAFSYSALP